MLCADVHLNVRLSGEKKNLKQRRFFSCQHVYSGLLKKKQCRSSLTNKFLLYEMILMQRFNFSRRTGICSSAGTLPDTRWGSEVSPWREPTDPAAGSGPPSGPGRPGLAAPAGPPSAWRSSLHPPSRSPPSSGCCLSGRTLREGFQTQECVPPSTGLHLCDLEDRRCI